MCEEPGGAGGLLIEDLPLAQVASAANICFCLSLLISSLTALGTSRFHALFRSLYLFCGPLRQGRLRLLHSGHSEALRGVREAVSGLCAYTVLPSLLFVLPLCVVSREQLLDLTSPGAPVTGVFSSHMLSPLTSQRGAVASGFASRGPSMLLQPGETPVSPGEGSCPALRQSSRFVASLLASISPTFSFCTLSLQGVSIIYFETFRESFPACPPFIFLCFLFFYARKIIEPKNHSRQYKTAQIFLSFSR